MRASRLLQLVLRLQLRGGASASELARELEVSVRTIHRDVDALVDAGVPVFTELGRNGGIRLDPSYRLAGLPTLDSDEARAMLFAAVPSIAADLGLDAEAAERTLLPAMATPAEAAARVVRERLLVEPGHWFRREDPAPTLTVVAAAVWASRELLLTYRGARTVVQPYGLVLKGSTWYLLGRALRGLDRTVRLYRVSRIDAAELSDHRFERPEGFDLAAAWHERREAFLSSLPRYDATVRLAPGAEPLLAMLDEAAPSLPLADDVPRDDDGWALLDLAFERTMEGSGRHLLRLGAAVEVLAPAELRAWLATQTADLADRYAAPAPRAGTLAARRAKESA